MINSYFNSIGKSSTRFGNQATACVCLYLLVGKVMNYIFQEELESYDANIRCAIFGMLTGSIYKSTRGFRPAVLGSVLGGILGYSFNYYWVTRMHRNTVFL